MKSIFSLSILLLIFSFTASAQVWKTYPYNPGNGSLVTFPNDEGRHVNEPVEWWYTVAHVTGNTTGTEYTYMLTYFYFPQLGFDGFRIFNLSNEDLGVFHTETLPVTYPSLSTNSLDIQASVFAGSPESWVTKKDTNGNLMPFQYHINATHAKGMIDVDYNTTKRPLILGGDGFFYQGGMGNYTYYYSQSEIAVTGTITMDNVTEGITGTAWIDRQYGTFNPNTGEKYEWFSVRLNNGMDLNIWNIFDQQNQVPDTILYRMVAGYVNDTTSFTVSDFSLDRSKYAYMSDSGMCYSQEWHLVSDTFDIDILMTTRHSNSEVSLPFRFFEGNIDVTGTVDGFPVTGVGFAELLHNYEKPQIDITYPMGYFDPSGTFPINWDLGNPDDGMSFLYDVEVTYDHWQSSAYIGQGLTATTLSWMPSGIQPDSSYGIRVTGYSPDTTVIGYALTSGLFGLVGISEELSLENKVHVFPNPAVSLVTVTVDGANVRLTHLSLRDVQGRKIEEVVSNIGNGVIVINVLGLESGVYFLEIGTDEGKVTRRIVVE